MKNQPVYDRPGRTEANDAQAPDRRRTSRITYFTEDEFPGDLSGDELYKSFKAWPGTTLSPEINPEDFERTYLWFLS